MNIAEWAIRNKTFTLVITILLIGAGIYYYDKLGRLEDPEFTIKDAQVITLYPGASPKEVEEEVTDELETAIQELAQLKRIESESKAGVSVITVTIKDKYDKHSLPQVWDELRRKVNDAQAKLPPGAQPSIVYDDYGDVFGILIAIHGKGYSYRELKDYADFLKRELLLIKDVAKVVPWGEQQEQVFVEISRSRMAQLGVSLRNIYATLAKQNLVVPSGSIQVGKEYIRLNPTGEIKSVKEIGNLLIKSNIVDKLVYLKDIATVKRGYITPPSQHLRIDGNPAIALGISTVSGGNVVKMGEAIEKRIGELKSQTPAGIKIKYIYYQGEIVSKSVNSFVINLIEAIIIVIVVLMIFMGLRSGILIGTVLLLTVCSTIVAMYIFGINLERISLGALIIALGMLVDNAIVVTEGILIRMQKGVDGLTAAKEIVAQSMWPLLAATVIAILAFAAIGLSQDATGEFLRSLYYVMLISLGLSWIIAITVTPLFCVMFLKVSGEAGDQNEDPYQGFIFKIYKSFLKTCVRFRTLTIAVVFGFLGLAIYGFGFLEDSFFPDSTSEQFMVHYWLPQGTDMRETSESVKKVEEFIAKQEGVQTVASFIGAGAPRFMLVYSPEKVNTAYAFLLVKVNDYRIIDKLSKTILTYLEKHHINSNPRIEKIRLGPGGGFPLEARFSGPNHSILRSISERAEKIMRDDGGARGIRNNWRERVKVIRPLYADATARRAGISRDDIAKMLQSNFSGRKVGIYREGDELLPILSRAPKDERVKVDNIYDVLVWSPVTNRMIPLQQVISGFKTSYEDAIIHRRNRMRTITTQSEQKKGNASVVLERTAPTIKNIKLPIGYKLEWGGEYEDSSDAQKGLVKNLPVTFLMMVLITIALFNSLRVPLIIWLTVPLAIIGVTVGLLVTNESFGFMPLLGFLSLSGMLIKNAIVLLDEINTQIASGKEHSVAIIDAAVSRMRPVTMAAITTILGMLPLLTDVFFFGMAVTIMSGLAFATVLTLIIVPVFYALFFRVPYQKEKVE